MTTTDDSALLSVAQAAHQLGVSPSTIWRWVDAGKLPAYRIGRKKIRVTREDLEQMVKPAGDRQAVSDALERIKSPSKGELERRQAIVQKILKNREQRVIVPLTASDLVQMAREHEQQAYGKLR